MKSLPGIPVDLFECLGWVLVHSLWQFAGIAIAALALSYFLRRSSAELRYCMLLFALTLMAVSSVTTYLLVAPKSSATRELANGEPLLTRLSIENSFPPQPANESFVEALPGISNPSNGRSIESVRAAMIKHVSQWQGSLNDFVQPWLAEIVCAWVAGVAIALLRPLFSCLTVRRLRRSGGSVVPDNVQHAAHRMMERLRLRKDIQILESSHVQSPLLLGYIRPLILLPLSMSSGMPVSQIEAIVAHELAHIRRHDYLFNVLQTLLETVFFYHPAVWWVSAHLRRERENCCDDMAAAAVGSRLEYGRALLTLVEMRGACTPLALGARSGLFLQRIRRLFEPFQNEPAHGLGSILGFGMFLSAALLVALWAETFAQEPIPAREASDDAKQLAKPEPPDEQPVQQPLLDIPKLLHIPTHERSAVGWQAGDNVHFVLYAQGFLQTGLSTSFTSQGDWKIDGFINLLKDRKVVRRFEILHSSAEPNTFHLDGKAYPLGALASEDSTDGTTMSGRLFILREHGEPIRTARTLPLKSEADLDASQAGSLAFSADLDLYLAETYQLSRALAAEPGWVIAWDNQHPIQHGDGARVARLRVFADGRVAAWAGIGQPLIEGRIDVEEVTSLVNWLLDEKNATPRQQMDAKAPDGKKTKLSIDPLPGALWDQEGNRVAVKRGDRTFDLVAITPPQDLPPITNDTAYLSDDVVQRLQDLIQAADEPTEP